MNAPRFSIVTVCLNAEKELPETYSSLQAQSFRDFEWIVVDGGSSDGTVDQIKGYASSLSVKWISEKDSGIYNAMNKGLQLGSGTFLHFLNAGDAYRGQDVLQDVNDRLMDEKTIYYGQTISIDPRTGATNPMNLPRTDILTLFHTVINHQAMFAPRSLFKEHGGFDENFRVYADYDWYLRNFIRNKVSIQFIDVEVCSYKRGGYSDMNYEKIGRKEHDSIRRKYYGSQYGFLRSFLFKRQFLWFTRRILKIRFIYSGLNSFFRWQIS